MEDAWKIIIGVILIVFAIIKNIIDASKNKSPKVYVRQKINTPLNAAAPGKASAQATERKPQPVRAADAEGQRAVADLPADDAGPAATPSRTVRRRSPLRAAFINSEIFNRKY